MRPSVTLFAFGKPKAQPRTRATIRGRHAGLYTPGDADDWKSAVRAEWKAHCAGNPKDSDAWKGPLKVTLTFFMPRPKSHFKTGKKSNELKANAPIWYVKKPDRDNLDKAVLDALTNAGAWEDDCQVVCGGVKKMYVRTGTQIGCRIEIAEAGEPFSFASAVSDYCTSMTSL